MCCCLSGEPIEDPKGRFKTRAGSQRFQTNMCCAPFAACPWTCCWFICQFIPITGGCTQCMLRRKVLHGDMSKYRCFQGQFSFCCGMIGAGSCGEESCPDLCNFLEGCCCNCLAVSANRLFVQDKYDLESDPCDYRLIRFNNCMQCLACCCHILALIDGSFAALADLIQCIADLVYACVSGCMTAQTAHEQNYQDAKSGDYNGSSSTNNGMYETETVVVAEPVQKY